MLLIFEDLGFNVNISNGMRASYSYKYLLSLYCEFEGPWKKKNLHEMGIVTQCISPGKHNDQYFTNVLLKINAKVGKYIVIALTTSCLFSNS